MRVLKKSTKIEPPFGKKNLGALFVFCLFSPYVCFKFVFRLVCFCFVCFLSLFIQMTVRTILKGEFDKINK